MGSKIVAGGGDSHCRSADFRLSPRTAATASAGLTRTAADSRSGTLARFERLKENCNRETNNVPSTG